VATETVVTRVCDMKHAEERPAEPFELYSKVAGRYEVDLCASCAEVFFGQVIVNGRRVIKRRK